MNELVINAGCMVEGQMEQEVRVRRDEKTEIDEIDERMRSGEKR